MFNRLGSIKGSIYKMWLLTIPSQNQILEMGNEKLKMHSQPYDYNKIYQLDFFKFETYRK